MLCATNLFELATISRFKSPLFYFTQTLIDFYLSAEHHGKSHYGAHAARALYIPIEQYRKDADNNIIIMAPAQG